jgi:glycosyltransferase involved in cell wall biosynthesis
VIDAASRIDVSIVAPIHNEAGNIEALCSGIRAALNGTCLSYEIIFVNDASTDNSLVVMKQLRCRYAEFHFVDVASNVGENWALLAGMSRARGRVLVSIDGDYQNDPAYIPALLERLGEGYRVVSGRRDQRVGNRWSRLLPSQIANTLIRLVSGVPVHDCGCGLKAYRREVVENKFVPTGFMNRFSPVALGVQANEFAEVDVIDRPRQYGESHYGLDRIFIVMRDLLVIRFAVDGPAKWLARFRLIAGFAGALCLGAVYYQSLAMATVLAILAVAALINIWNLGRFIEAQKHPQFRIREFK